MPILQENISQENTCQENTRVVLFGSDFDPNPDIDGVRRKVTSFIETEGKSSHKGPYDYLKDGLEKRKIQFRAGGKFPCEDWLSTTPDLLSSGEIYPEQYRKFIDNGSCLKYARDFGDYIVRGCKDGEIPVVVAVDHALTGGIIEKLQEKRDEKIKIVVFDAHLDAIPPAIRNGLVNYMRERYPGDSAYLKYEHYDNSFKGAYDTGSFLYWLLEEQIIKPENLIIIGIQDEPSAKLRNIKDPRIDAFLKSYDNLLKQGVTIWPLSAILKRHDFEKQISYIRNKLIGESIYLSIDMDVLKGNLGESTRYGTGYGLSVLEIIEIIRLLKLDLRNIVAIDLMEMDVNKFISLGMEALAIESFYRITLSILEKTGCYTRFSRR